MPVVNGKQYPYTAAGIAAANKAKKSGNPGNAIGAQNRNLRDLQTRGVPGQGVPPQPGIQPRTALNKPTARTALNRPTRSNNVQQPGPVTPKPPINDPTSKARKGKGYNFTRNLGGTPDIGY
tara:strand:+ start:156 stop:521 length:366 start_codon:yes stop_codon:yes gene_type:complete